MSDPPKPSGADGLQKPPDSDSEPAPDLLTRLDPDRANKAPPVSRLESDRHDPKLTLPPSAVIDTRRYRWTIGIFGLVLVVAVSVYQFATHGIGTTGVPPGQRLHFFAAPLANTNLNGDPNLKPPCTLIRHDPRALNVCLLSSRTPLVLSLFVIGSNECEHQVDALQTLSREFPTSEVRFAAVAVHATHSATAAVIRSHGWTIPVAYDRDGSIGGLYGVQICPMVEFANRGGVVKERLIGDQWQSAANLAPRVRALALAGSDSPGAAK